MKALSIHQPYANQIMTGEKGVEYRSWATKYRGDLLICSTKNPKVLDLLCGYALCVVELFAIGYAEKSNNDKRNWWCFANIRKIKPFPVKGQQRLFNVDDELIEYL
jgi:hypothetical protein